MRVSILIPTVNPKKAYLQQAISSIPETVNEIVFAGTGFNFKDYKLPFVKIIRVFETGLALTEAVNAAVNEYVTGDWFSILPDDDFYLEGIAGIIEEVKNSAADIVNFPMVHYVNEERRPGFFCDDKNVTFEKNYQRNLLNGSAFIRRSSFLWLEGYKGQVCMDWDLFNRALKSKMLLEHVDIPGLALRYNSHSKMQKLAQQIGMENISREVKKNTDAWDKKIYARCAVGMGPC